MTKSILGSIRSGKSRHQQTAFTPQTPYSQYTSGSEGAMRSPSLVYFNTPEHSLDSPGHKLSAQEEAEFICNVCSMPLQSSYMIEEVVKFTCSHSAHEECYREMMTTVPQNSYFACTICDRRCVPHEKPSIIRRKPASILPQLVRRRMGSNLVKMPSMAPIRITAIPEREQLDIVPGTPTHRSKQTVSLDCLVSIAVPTTAFFQKLYTPTAEDMRYGIERTRKLRQAVHPDRSLDHVDLGMLRLESQLQMSTDQLTWRKVNCYLYPFVLVMTMGTGDSEMLETVIDLRRQLKNVSIVSIPPGVHNGLRIALKSRLYSTVYLTGVSNETLNVWKYGLMFSDLSYPVAPESRIAAAEFSPLSERVPVNLVLCLPYPDSEDLLDTLKSAVQKVIYKCSNLDNVAVVFYGRKTIVTGMQRRGWRGWRYLFDSLPEPCSHAQDLQTAFEAVQNMFTDFNPEVSIGSILLVAHEKVTVSEIPSRIILADIPINTLGIGDHHSAELLSALASRTNGMYQRAADHEEAIDLIAAITRNERLYTHCGTEVRLRTPNGILISEILGSEQGPDVTPLLQSPLVCVRDGNEDVKAIPGKNVVLHIGKLKAGQLHSFLVRVDVDIKAFNPNSTIEVLEIQVRTRSVTSKGLNLPVPSSSVQVVLRDPVNSYKGLIPAPSLSEKPDIVVIQRKMSLLAASVFQQTLFSNTPYFTRNIVDQLRRVSRAIEALVRDANNERDKSEELLKDSAIALGTYLQRLIDRLAETIHKKHGFGTSISELIQDAWTLNCEFSYTNKTRLGEFYAGEDPLVSMSDYSSFSAIPDILGRLV